MWSFFQGRTLCFLHALEGVCGNGVFKFNLHRFGIVCVCVCLVSVCVCLSRGMMHSLFSCRLCCRCLPALAEHYT